MEKFKLQPPTLMLIILFSLPMSSPVWLQSPGAVYVCEGDTATLYWKYDHTIGEFDAASFYKIKPARQLLVSVIAGETPRSYTSWVGYMDGKSEITLDNVQLIDNGTYEIEVNFDKYTKLIYNQAVLNVLAGCPERGIFERPVVLYKETSDTSSSQKILIHRSIIIDRESDVTLFVAIPAARPSVTCLVTHGETTYSCKGISAQEVNCEVELHFEKDVVNILTVTLKYVALKPSVTEIEITFSDANEEEKRSESRPILSQENTGIIIALIVIIVLFCGIPVLYFIRKHKKDQPPLHIEEVSLHDSNGPDASNTNTMTEGIRVAPDNPSQFKKSAECNEGHAEKAQLLSDPQNVNNPIAKDLDKLRNFCKSNADTDLTDEEIIKALHLAQERNHTEVSKWFAVDKALCLDRAKVPRAIICQSLSPFTMMIAFCPYKDFLQRSTTKSSHKTYDNLMEIDKTINLKCSGCQSYLPKSSLGLANEFHYFHKQAELFLQHFLHTLSPQTAGIENMSSFQFGSSVGVVDHLRYQIQLDIPNANITAQVGGNTFEFCIPLKDQLGLASSVSTFFARGLGILISRQLEEEGLIKKQVLVHCYQSSSGSEVCVNLSWLCPENHTHDVKIDLLPSVIWKPKRLYEVFKLPEVVAQSPFGGKSSIIENLPVMLEPNCASVNELTSEGLTSVWSLSYEKAFPVLSECLYDNTRICFRLLKFLRDFLPMRMVYSKEGGHWESRPLILSRVLLNVLLQEVMEHSSHNEWGQSQFINRLASLLSNLTLTKYTHFFLGTKHDTIDTAHLSESQQLSLLEAMVSDVESMKNLIMKKDAKDVFIFKSNRESDASPESVPTSLKKATQLATNSVICVMNFASSREADVRYAVHSDWKYTEYPVGGVTDDFFCYKIPMPNMACSQNRIYQDLYNVFMEKFDTNKKH